MAAWEMARSLVGLWVAQMGWVAWEVVGREGPRGRSQAGNGGWCGLCLEQLARWWAG